MPFGQNYVTTGVHSLATTYSTVHVYTTHRYASSVRGDLCAIESPDSFRTGVSSEVDSESDWICVFADDERVAQTWVRGNKV